MDGFSGENTEIIFEELIQVIRKVVSDSALEILNYVIRHSLK